MELTAKGVDELEEITEALLGKSTVTVAEVKRDLPDVDLIWNGKRYSGRVSGRLNRFASVYGRKVVRRKHGSYVTPFPATPDFQFAWETIAQALTNGKPLRA